MKPITVREAAKALNLTKRAIMYRLENGKLKGIRVRNDFGMEEWRIYPTKEILEGLQRAISANPTIEPSTLIDDVYDAEEVGDEEDFSDREATSSWAEKERERAKVLAEEFVRPLLERLDQQTRQLAYAERELDDLKVKLLPDLKKQAETERKAAELKELEAEALRKQIAALQSQQKEADLAKEKVAELEHAVTQIQNEKDIELVFLKQQVAELTEKLPKPSKSWWNWFISPSTK